jgi:hypothetical protein
MQFDFWTVSLSAACHHGCFAQAVPTPRTPSTMLLCVWCSKPTDALRRQIEPSTMLPVHCAAQLRSDAYVMLLDTGCHSDTPQHCCTVALCAAPEEHMRVCVPAAWISAEECWGHWVAFTSCMWLPAWVAFTSCFWICACPACKDSRGTRVVDRQAAAPVPVAC